jgi:anthranilate phosphoribosyltransferase
LIDHVFKWYRASIFLFFGVWFFVLGYLGYHSCLMPETKQLLEAVCKIRGGHSLSVDEMSSAFRVIMGGGATDGVIGAFLGILATRVPTGDELCGAAVVMRERVARIEFPGPSALVDTCGTGGAPKTFNVSTAAGIVTAACGVRVAKHGNRSRTGRGSAEVLEQLGVNINIGVDKQKECLEKVGICFCYAPKHHKAVAHVMPVRKQLGFPTIFNLLGPLTNPCSAGRQLLGVWDDKYVEPMAAALQSLGTTKSAVVHSVDGLDEISIAAPTRMVLVDQGGLIEESIDPGALDLQRWSLESVTATTLLEAKELMIKSITGGQESGPRDMVLMSTAVSLFLAERVESVREGVELASKTIDSGQALNTLHEWAEISNTHNPSTEQ